jgi:hypothetical protein
VVLHDGPAGVPNQEHLYDECGGADVVPHEQPAQPVLVMLHGYDNTSDRDSWLKAQLENIIDNSLNIIYSRKFGGEVTEALFGSYAKMYVNDFAMDN